MQNSIRSLGVILTLFMLLTSFCLAQTKGPRLLPPKKSNGKPVVFPPPVLESPDYTAFCTLSKVPNSFIYTRALYTRKTVYIGKAKAGNYWCLASPDNNCNNLNANLYLSDASLSNPKYVKLLQYAKKHNAGLLIDVVGILEEDKTWNEHSYEFIAPFKWRFIAKHIVDMQLATR